VDAHGLDPVAILSAMGVSAPASVEPAEGGFDTAIWHVESAGEGYALRVFRPEQAETCRREVAAMSAARLGGIPVPAVHKQIVWHDRPALLLSWCEGSPMLERVRERALDVFKLGAALGRMQARLHLVRAPDDLLGDPDAWIRLAGPDEMPLQRRLRAVGGPTDRLLHLDFHPLNVLVESADITAVLDWANALAGDPRADLARTVTILRLAPGVPNIPARLLRRALESSWRRGYRLEPGPSHDMPLFYAWAGAAMLQDLLPKLGRRRGLEPQHLDVVRIWTEAWKRRAGV